MEYPQQAVVDALVFAILDHRFRGDDKMELFSKQMNCVNLSGISSPSCRPREGGDPVFAAPDLRFCKNDRKRVIQNDTLLNNKFQWLFYFLPAKFK